MRKLVVGRTSVCLLTTEKKTIYLIFLDSSNFKNDLQAVSQKRLPKGFGHISQCPNDLCKIFSPVLTFVH